MYDTIIIGSGPAGMTAAIYLLRSNKKVLIIEKNGIGGQIASSPLVENYPGIKSISGSDFANGLFEQVENLGGEIAIEEVLKITSDKEVITDYNKYKAKSIIIATGCNHRKLGLENEENLIGNGIHFCVSCDGAFYKNKKVGVIGGGNTALINALSLSEICEEVHIFQLLDYLTAEEMLINQVSKKENVKIHLNTVVEKYLGEDELSGLVISTNNNKETINLDGVFLSIGLIPSSDKVNGLIEVDDYGYIKSSDTLTNIEGIFVAGDVRQKQVRQITTATNDGTIAAINAINYLRDV